MTYTYYLIVNRSGILSTVADLQQFESGAFLTTADLFFSYQVSLSDANLAWLMRVWQDCVVVGPGLPITSVEQITDPTHTYLLLQPGPVGYTIAPVELAYDLVVRYHANMRLTGIEAAYAHAKLGRFVSSASGTARWYDGSDFLLYATPFAMRGVSDGFTCAPSLTADWEVTSHTPEQVMAVGADYATWHQQLRERFQAYQTQLRAATSLAEVQAVKWV